MYYLICVWINGWVNNGEAGDLTRHRAHYDVTVMRASEISKAESDKTDQHQNHTKWNIAWAEYIFLMEHCIYLIFISLIQCLLSFILIDIRLFHERYVTAIQISMQKCISSPTIYNNIIANRTMLISVAGTYYQSNIFTIASLYICPIFGQEWVISSIIFFSFKSVHGANKGRVWIRKLQHNVQPELNDLSINYHYADKTNIC